jgi:hypothetical protein
MKIVDHLNMGGVARIQSLPAPVSDAEPARLIDLNSAIEGLKNKDAVVASAQGNINIASPGATIDGQTPVSGSRENGAFLLRAQTAPAENGIWIWNGAASPMTRALDANAATELNNAVVRVRSGTDAGVTFRQTATVVTLDTDAVTFATFGGGSPAASETTPGIAEIATQAETDAGTDDARIVTPLKLAAYAGRMRRTGATIGDNSATQFDITHNFGTDDIEVEVWETGGNKERVFPTVSKPNTNTVRINFASVPAVNSYRVVIFA